MSHNPLQLLQVLLDVYLTFTLTLTLHLQIDGASSRSIERHFLDMIEKFCNLDQFEVLAPHPKREPIKSTMDVSGIPL